jgi:hypothetical protein
MALGGQKEGGWDEGGRCGRCESCRVSGLFCMLKCSSVVVGESTCVRDGSNV